MKQPYCNQCGDCCRGFSDEMGIEIRSIDAERIAKFLDLSIAQFLEQYTYVEYLDEEQSEAVHYLYDDNGSCLFLSADNCCQINAVKPAQCAVGWPDKQFLQYMHPNRDYPCLIDDSDIDVVLCPEN